MISSEYAAGFVDGEGSITIAARADSRYAALCVTVANTYHAVLVDLCERWGGSVHDDSTRKRFGHRQIWFWRIDAAKAERFLRDVAPFLRVKRRQADIAFELRGLTDNTLGNHPLSDDQVWARKVLRGLMKALNHGETGRI